MGIFSIGFNLIEVKDIVTASCINAVVIVSFDDLEFRTPVYYDKIGYVPVNVKHSWSGIELTTEQSKFAKIGFRLESANTFTANDIVGSTDVQLMLVLQRSGHKLHEITPLLNPRNGEISANLEFELTVSGSEIEDTVTRAFDNEDPALDLNLESAVVENKTKNVPTGSVNMLYVNLLSLEYHKPLPTAAKLSVSVDFTSQSLMTRCSGNPTSLSIHATCKFAALLPLMEDTIRIKIWNTTPRVPVLLGDGDLSFTSIRVRPVPPAWYNFYSNDLRDRNGYKSFVGRLLLSCFITKLKPNAPLKGAYVTIVKEHRTLASIILTICVDLFMLYTTVADADSLVISIQGVRTVVNLRAVSSSSKLVNNTKYYYYRFDSRTGRPSAIQVPSGTRDGSTCAHLFLELYDGSNVRQAFNYIKVKHIQPVGSGISAQLPTWIVLHDNNTNSMGGLLISSEKSIRDGAEHRNRAKVVKDIYELRCYIYAAKHLPLNGKTGRSPITQIVIDCGGFEAETEAFRDESRYPVFLSCIRFDIELMVEPRTGLAPLMPIKVSCKDVNDGSIFCELVTTFHRSINSQEHATPHVPRWYSLRTIDPMHFVDVDEAAVLLHTEIVPISRTAVCPPQQLAPYLSSVRIQLALWGLRSIRWLHDPSNITTTTLEGLTQASKKLEKPILVIHIPQYTSGGGLIEEKLGITYKKKNDEGEKNAQFCDFGTEINCFDFLATYSIPMLIPCNPIFDPHITFKLYSGTVDDPTFVGECSVPISSYMPWYDGPLPPPLGESTFADRAAVLARGGAVLRTLNPFSSTDDTDANALPDAEPDVTDELCGPNGVPKWKPQIESNLTQFGVMPSYLVHSNYIHIPRSMFVSVDASLRGQSKKQNMTGRINNMPSLSYVPMTMEAYVSDIGWIEMPFLYAINTTVVHSGYLFYAIRVVTEDSVVSCLPNYYPDVFMDSASLRRGLKTIGLPSVAKIRVTLVALRLISVKNLGSSATLELYIGGKRVDTIPIVDADTLNYSNEADLWLPNDSIMYLVLMDSGGRLQQRKMIGHTRINLISRLMSREFKDGIEHETTPIEIRPILRSDATLGYIGAIHSLIEVAKSNSKFRHLSMLSQVVRHAVEIRVVIWGCRNLELLDANSVKVSDTVDCYVTSEFSETPSPQLQQTDVHYGSDNGSTVYNYRVVYKDVKYETDGGYVLKFAAYQYYALNPSQLIGDVILNLHDYVAHAARTRQLLSYNVELRLRKKDCTTGFLQATVQILSMVESDTRPVGMGREAPNRDPQLFTPSSGRSWNDFLGANNRNYMFDQFWYTLRWVTLLTCILIIIIVGAIRPGIFYMYPE